LGPPEKKRKIVILPIVRGGIGHEKTGGGTKKKTKGEFLASGGTITSRGKKVRQGVNAGNQTFKLREGKGGYLGFRGKNPKKTCSVGTVNALISK